MNGLSRWTGGGPNGASWNVHELRCLVEVATACRSGAVTLELTIGSRRVRTKTGRFDREHPLLPQEFAIREADWTKSLDPPRKRWPYRTAILRATASVTACEEPDEAPGRDLAEKSFVAGFAYGE
jgi:hypothetical protein